MVEVPIDVGSEARRVDRRRPGECAYGDARGDETRLAERAELPDGDAVSRE
jgi:hypothetical protein